MKKNIFLFLLPVLSVICSAPVHAEFTDTPLGRYVIRLGMDFIRDPGDFLLTVHHNTVDFTPVTEGSRWAIQTGIFPAFLPFTAADMSVKVKLFSESDLRPQIDVAGTYWNMLAVELASRATEDVSGHIFGYAAGAVFTKKVNERNRFFLAANWREVRCRFLISDPITMFEKGDEDDEDRLGFEIGEIILKEPDFHALAGLEYRTRNNNHIVVSSGYDFDRKKIAAKVVYSLRHWEYGIAVYPESIWVIQPTINLHFRF